jgi:hypothetical protein
VETEIGQPQRCAEVLANVAAGLPVGQLDTEAQAAGNDRDLLRLDVQDAELGRQAKPPQLGNDQELAIL